MKSLLALAAAATIATSASAATLFSMPASTPEMPSPDSYSVVFASAGGAGATSFTVNGYASLDGLNCCTDTFTLSLNGTDIFSGTFDLGGGGSNVVFIPGSATYTATSFGFYQGGQLTVSTPLTLLAGSNTLTFRYDGAPQGLADEGWGVGGITVTGDATVPEPASWLLFVAGFGLVGAAVRRRGATALAA